MLENFLIAASGSLRDALQRIERNHHGVIFISDEVGAIFGIATDGDIRRWLVEGGSLNDAIELCANTDFVWESPATPRELLLKRLDDRIRVVPLLDSTRRLAGVVSRKDMPVQPEGAVYARARAPVRVSFGGGGSDLTHFFLDGGGGAVINAAISLSAHATLRLRDDSRIVVSSLDLGETLEAENLPALLGKGRRFGLIQALLQVINPEFGFELFLNSDFPMGSGLGGSAAVSAAILGCFNQFRRDQWDLYELAEFAYQAERHYFGIVGGWQDQYASVFGGFNFMEFRLDQNIVHPLRIHSDTLLELEECLVLCDTGSAHNSGDIQNNHVQRMSATHMRNILETNMQLSYAMRNDLLRGRLHQFGLGMDRAWHLKRELSREVSSSYLDDIYAQARKEGAVGGKLLGAGGGGFFLFYVPPVRKHRLLEHLMSRGLGVRPFRFESYGLQAWKVRESRARTEGDAPDL